MATGKQGRRGFDRDTIIQIRRAWRYGHSAAEIGQAWGISERSARLIATGQTYRRVVDDSPDTPPLPLQLPKAASRRGRVVVGPGEVPANPADSQRVDRTGRENPQISQCEKVVRRQRPAPRQ